MKSEHTLGEIQGGIKHRRHLRSRDRAATLGRSPEHNLGSSRPITNKISFFFKP